MTLPIVIAHLLKAARYNFPLFLRKTFNKEFESEMRIDKYLWSTRYYKTRSLASAACRKGQVQVNGQVAKPSREVFPADAVTVRINQLNHQLKIVALPPNRMGAKLVNLYREVTTPAEAFENKELLQYSKDYYRAKGSGRPSKKDRRDISGYLEDPE